MESLKHSMMVTQMPEMFAIQFLHYFLLHMAFMKGLSLQSNQLFNNNKNK